MYWLEDSTMLPAAIPNSRIMRYGYTSGWFGAGAIKTKAPVISRQLLPELAEESKRSLLAHPVTLSADSCRIIYLGHLSLLRIVLGAWWYFGFVESQNQST